MEEILRKEFHQLWMKKHDGEITKDEYRKQVKDRIDELLEENPKRLLDLCVGHIRGLTEENLLDKARKDPCDFVYMNISAGSYSFQEIAQKPSNPNSRKIKTIYRKILQILGLDDKEAKKILNKASKDDEYDAYPAETILDILIDEELCASIDWKFGLEDVEYNLNLIAKKLHLNPIKEYPPYEEGQPLGFEAIEQVIGESEYSAAGVRDGDETCVFLLPKGKAELIAEELDKLEAFWSLEDVFVID